MHKYILKNILAFYWMSFAVFAFGQQDCERNLEKARVLFEKGYLEDIPTLLEPCVKDNYRWPNRTAALKLLTESYLFMGQEEKADTFYMALLLMEPEYTPVRNEDHPELVYFAEKFSTKPFFGYGVKLGYNFPSVNNRKTYFLEDSLSSVADNYQGISKIQFGLFGDFNINHSNFDISTELMFTNIGYKLITDMLYNEPNITGNLSFEEHLRFIDLGANVKYYFKPIRVFKNVKSYKAPIKAHFYLSGGLALNFLYYARMEDLNFSKSDVSSGIIFIDKQQSTGLDLLAGSSPLRNTLNYSYNAAAGFKLRFKKAFWVFDFRYNGMINSVVNSDNRYNNEGLQRLFRHVDNDIALNSFVISVGFGFTLSHSVRKIQ